MASSEGQNPGLRSLLVLGPGIGSKQSAVPGASRSICPDRLFSTYPVYSLATHAGWRTAGPVSLLCWCESAEGGTLVLMNSATAGNTTVTLAWSAPASNGGSAITGYRVYRGMASGGETLVATLGNVTGWVDRTQQGGTVYYEITAVNAVGESARSNELSTGKVHK